MSVRNLTRLGCIGLLAWFMCGCNEREFETTEDGVVIVPFGQRRTGHANITADIRADLDCWLNFMPQPGVTSPGPPLLIALRVHIANQGPVDPQPMTFLALSLWSESGDSLIAALALVNVQGGPALLPGSGAQMLEFTNDRTRPRTVRGGQNVVCAPRLLIETNGDRVVHALPPVRIEAVY